MGSGADVLLYMAYIVNIYCLFCMLFMKNARCTMGFTGFICCVLSTVCCQIKIFRFYSYWPLKSSTNQKLSSWHQSVGLCLTHLQCYWKHSALNLESNSNLVDFINRLSTMRFSIFQTSTFLLFLVASFTVGNGADATTAPDELVVQLKSGPVRGSTKLDVFGLTVEQFLGIPYAAPPVGELRFAPPQPVTPWEDVRDGTKYGASCPQNKEWFPWNNTVGMFKQNISFFIQALSLGLRTYIQYINMLTWPDCELTIETSATHVTLALVASNDE